MRARSPAIKKKPWLRLDREKSLRLGVLRQASSTVFAVRSRRIFAPISYQQCWRYICQGLRVKWSE